MAETEAQPVIVFDEDANRLEWRTERFEELGYPHRIAAFLASEGIDHWKAKRMIDGGCSLSDAMRILV
jgi:hypothetical protein